MSDETVKGKYGFVPRSVLYFAKDEKLLGYFDESHRDKSGGSMVTGKMIVGCGEFEKSRFVCKSHEYVLVFKKILGTKTANVYVNSILNNLENEPRSSISSIIPKNVGLTTMNNN